MAESQAELELLSLVIQKERKAISIFMDTYGGFIYNVCYKILLNSKDAEEATQDSMMKVLKALPTFDQKSSLKAWCYTIAYRTAIDHKRKIKYTSDISAVPEMSYSGSAEDNVKAEEVKKNINALIAHLDEESRMIVMLYYLEEKNIKELMEITGLTESNLKIKLFRARKELSNHAPKYFESINV